MGRHRRSVLGAGLMLLVLLATSFGLATSFAASAEHDAGPATSRIVDVHSDQAVMPPAKAVNAPARDGIVTRLLRLTPFVALFVALALAASLTLSWSGGRRHRALGQSLLVASGVSRRGPPLVV